MAKKKSLLSIFDLGKEKPFYLEEDSEPVKKKKNKRMPLWKMRKKQGEGFWQGEIE